MHDDDVMDRLLREALAAEAPRLSPEFDARVMRRVRPRRLRPMGRVLIAAYGVAAAAAAAWLMRDMQPAAIAAAVVINLLVAAGAGAYGRRLAA